jgi:phosphate/sulfate permease
MSLGSVLLVVLAVVLLACAVLVFRSSTANSWTAIVLAMLTCGVSFTVGGNSGDDASGPSVATVVGAVVGVLSVAAAIISLVPSSRESRPSRVPMILATAAIVIGAVGLAVSQLVS